MSRTRLRALVLARKAAALYRCWGAQSEGREPGRRRPRPPPAPASAPSQSSGGEKKGPNLLETGDLAGLQGCGIQHQHRAQAEDVPEQLVVLGVEKAVSSGPCGTAPGCPLPVGPPAHLEVVVHPGAQCVLEGGVDPVPGPAVHVEHLEAEADGLLLTLAALQVRGARTGLGGCAHCARGSGVWLTTASAHAPR